MRKIIFLPVLVFLFFCSSCNLFNGGDTPQIVFDPSNAMANAMVANGEVQAGHLQRIASAWSGQLVGVSLDYRNFYEYQISGEESNGVWLEAYPGVVTNVRQVVLELENDALLVGISGVLEAHAIGTLASIFGDIPYSEVLNSGISNPAFDNQKEVFSSLQTLLDQSISDLQAAVPRILAYDSYFRGDAVKWEEVAWTLKARYFLQNKNYPAAHDAALKGISESGNSMKFYPSLVTSVSAQNPYYEAMTGQYSGQFTTDNAYIMSLMGAREHAKTKESARRHYLMINSNSPGTNEGIADVEEPLNLVSYEENLLILAETAARTKGISDALPYLNELRSFLASGLAFRHIDTSDELVYEPFTEDDFQNGGIENASGMDPVRAFLREVIEERYISGYGTYIGFNDARRLRKSDQDISVKFPLNSPLGQQHPERFIIATDETANNTNAPTDPGIYAVTPVNQ